MAVGDRSAAQHDDESGTRLYGREGQLATFLAIKESPIIVTGGSGIGKSAFLTAVRDHANARAFTAPVIESARETPGSLQRIIIKLATVAIEELTKGESMLERLGERLLQAAKKVSRDHGTKLASAIVSDLVAFTKSRLGDGVGQALFDYAKELRSTETELEALRARINTSADPDVLAVAIDLAKEVAELTPNRELLLLIDSVERFSEGDLSQVAYLPDILSANVRLILAVSTQGAKARQAVTHLVTRGIAEYPIPPLTTTDVAYWAFQEGLPTEVADRIQKVTGGYPVFIPSAIRAIRENRLLSEVSITRTFDIETSAALREIDTESATAARRLSAFTDPIPDDRSAEFLGFTIYRWGEIQSRLANAGIFTTRVNGTLWFHEQRRKSVWRSITDAERRDAAERAYVELRQALERSRLVNPDVIVALAEIVTSVPSVISSEEKARTVAQASLDEIAVLASVIELAEASTPDELPLTSGASVLAHARSKFGLDVDLTPALISLCSKELLFEKSDTEASVVIPRLDALAVYVTAGRAGRDLGRFPIPRLASNVFEAAIRWRLEPFTRCVYGVGAPSAEDINVSLLAEERRSNPERLAFRRETNNNLLVLQLNLGSEQIYCGAQFATIADRDLARNRIRTLEGKLFGHDVDLVREYTQPRTTIAARKILIAAERAIGASLGSPDSTPRWQNLDDGVEAGDQNPAPSIAEMFRIARSICSEDERIAFNLLDRRRIAYLSNGEDLLTIEVFGNEDGVVDLEDVLDPAGPSKLFGRGPYRSFELERALQIKPGERIGMTRYRSERRVYTVYDCMFDLCETASEYNSFQTKKHVLLETNSLEYLLNEVAAETYHNAQLLAPALPGTLKPIRPRHTYLSISRPDKGTPGTISPGFYATYGAIELEYGEPEAVTVQMFDAENRLRPGFLDGGQSIRKAFDILANQNFSSLGEGVGNTVVASMLGYLSADVLFHFDDE